MKEITKREMLEFRAEMRRMARKALMISRRL
jgi:hypothetical protein